MSHNLTMMTATIDGHSQSHAPDLFSGVAGGAAVFNERAVRANCSNSDQESVFSGAQLQEL